MERLGLSAYLCRATPWFDFFPPSLHQSTPTNPTPVDKGQEQQSSSQVEFSTYNPDLEAVSSSDLAQSNLTPLPLTELTDSSLNSLLKLLVRQSMMSVLTPRKLARY